MPGEELKEEKLLPDGWRFTQAGECKCQAGSKVKAWKSFLVYETGHCWSKYGDDELRDKGTTGDGTTRWEKCLL